MQIRSRPAVGKFYSLAAATAGVGGNPLKFHEVECWHASCIVKGNGMAARVTGEPPDTRAGISDRLFDANPGQPVPLTAAQRIRAAVSFSWGHETRRKPLNPQYT